VLKNLHIRRPSPMVIFLGTHFRFHRLLIDGFIIHHIYATHTHFISIVKKQYMQLFSNPYFLFFISLNVVSFKIIQ